MAVVSLEEIKRQAKEVKDILSKCKTVEDLRNLRHIGINEYDITISVEGNKVLDYNKLLASYSPETKFTAVRLDYYDSNIDFPTYFPETNQFYFDVLDPEICEFSAYLENVSLDSIDEEYRDFFNHNKDYDVEEDYEATLD